MTSTINAPPRRVISPRAHIIPLMRASPVEHEYESAQQDQRRKAYEIVGRTLSSWSDSEDGPEDQADPPASESGDESDNPTLGSSASDISIKQEAHQEARVSRPRSVPLRTIIREGKKPVGGESFRVPGETGTSSVHRVGKESFKVPPAPDVKPGKIKPILLKPQTPPHDLPTLRTLIERTMHNLAEPASSTHISSYDDDISSAADLIARFPYDDPNLGTKIQRILDAHITDTVNKAILKESLQEYIKTARLVDLKTTLESYNTPMQEFEQSSTRIFNIKDYGQSASRHPLPTPRATPTPMSIFRPSQERILHPPADEASAYSLASPSPPRERSYGPHGRFSATPMPEDPFSSASPRTPEPAERAVSPLRHHLPRASTSSALVMNDDTDEDIYLRRSEWTGTDTPDHPKLVKREFGGGAGYHWHSKSQYSLAAPPSRLPAVIGDTYVHVKLASPSDPDEKFQAWLRKDSEWESITPLLRAGTSIPHPVRKHSDRRLVVRKDFTANWVQKKTEEGYRRKERSIEKTEIELNIVHDAAN
ncbi:hypothetical protein PLICRDRAFT_175673 [Plicaturopsis crispa FD-325 SS-3]|nr:hypothetical protein PLICRDRAFT_175673 [Plicaturopsis crispa FD-325 SS-3]